MKALTKEQKERVNQIITDMGWGGTKNAMRRALLVFESESISKSEVLTAVFEVKGSKHWSVENTEAVCDMRYVRLVYPITRGAAIEKIRKMVIEQHKTSQVTFKFWASTWMGSGPSPLDIRLS